MSSVLAIDPGNTQSAYVLFDATTFPGRIIARDIMPNEAMLDRIATGDDDFRHAKRLAIEGIACYGMAVGSETFDTCIWIGRFMQQFGAERTTLIYRPAVKLHLCKSLKAKDANVRQALIDRFGPGKGAAIGTKKQPGPCYGVASHCWSALAVAATFADTHRSSH